MEAAKLCGMCRQPAEFVCTCGSLLCRKCLSSHDQNSEGQHTFTVLPAQLDLFKALEQTAKAMDERLNLNDTQEFENPDLEATWRNIDEEIDHAKAELEKKREELKTQLRALSTEAKGRTLDTRLAALLASARELRTRIETAAEPCWTSGAEVATQLLLVKGKTVYAFTPGSSELSRVVESSELFPAEGAYCIALDHLFHCGGRVGSASCSQSQLLNLASGSVECRRSMSAARREHTVVLLGEVVHVLGGYSGRELLTVCERFSLGTQQFAPMASMLHARGSIGAAVSGGKIYVTGYGRRDDPSVCSCMEVYAPQSNAFSALPFALPSNSGAIGFAMDEQIAFLRGYHLLTYVPSTKQTESYPAEPRRYKSPTPALVMGHLIYFVVCSDDEYVVATMDWRSKVSRDVKDLKEWARI